MDTGKYTGVKGREKRYYKSPIHLARQHLQFYSQTVIDTVFAGVGFLDLAHI